MCASDQTEKAAYDFEDCSVTAVPGPHHGRVCNSAADASSNNNFCMLDNTLTFVEDNDLQILTGSCPDHRHSVGVMDRTSSSSSSSCSCSDSSGCSLPMVPEHNDWFLRIPRHPVNAAEPSALPLRGVVGVAVNGVVFMQGSTAEVFDDCLGHVDTHKTYHYRLPPVCLMSDLGGSFNSSSWCTGQWPSTGDPSPVLGWALDGWPIFGPYDEQGDLMTNSTLDRCGGKALGGNRGYGYFITPTGGVSCFTGYPGVAENRGLLVPLCACPAEGLQSLYCQDGEACAQMDLKVCATCDKAFFLFPSCPKLGTEFVDMARVWGVIYLVIFIALSIRGPLLWLFQKLSGREVSIFFKICRQSDVEWRPCPVRDADLGGVPSEEVQESDTKKAPKKDLVIRVLEATLSWSPRLLALSKSAYQFFTARVMQAFRGATVVCFSRMLFMLIDPWHVNQTLPALVVGPLYGVVFPTLNWCFVQSVFLLALRTGAMPSTPWLIKAQAIVSILEYLVQLVADVIRGLNVESSELWWLKMCQVYFLILGLGLSIAWFTVISTIWKSARESSLLQQRRFRTEMILISLTSPCKLSHSTFSLVLIFGVTGVSNFALLLLREVFVFLEFGLLLSHNLLTVYHASL